MTAHGMPQGSIIHFNFLNHLFNGFFIDISKLGKLKTVFADLPMREWQSGELYLVMRIIKRTKGQGVDEKKPIRKYVFLFMVLCVCFVFVLLYESTTQCSHTGLAFLVKITQFILLRPANLTFFFNKKKSE
jgi:hypothetical protein